jgi:hypothetical protein
MMALMVCCGVLIQNFLMVTSALLMDSAWLHPADAVAIVTNQLLWALFTGPLLLMLFRYFLSRLERFIDQLFEKNHT